MKRSTPKFLLAMAAVMGLGVSANADLLYTFDTSTGVPSTAAVPEAGGNMVAGSYTWTSYYGGEVQYTATTSGWNLGGTGPKFEFSWPVQSVMQGYANAGNYSVSFDMHVSDDWSFNYGTWADWDWYQLVYAANSDGGWHQNAGLPGNVYDGNYDATGTHGGNDHTVTVTASFTALGWTPGTTWYQLFFGSNSGGDDAVQFFVDNIHVFQVPEPGTLALAGLGAAAMLIFRRR